MFAGIQFSFIDKQVYSTGLPQVQIAKIHRVQNAAARLIWQNLG